MKNIVTLILLFLFFFASTQSLRATTYYVDASRPDNTGAGTSWATAKKDVQDAINLALAGDQVWVKAGTYKPTQYPAGCSGCSTARDYTFFVKDGVKLYGSFAGTETTLAQRNIAANTTTLSGEIGILTDTTDNSYHIVMAVAPSTGGIGVTVDGFTIRGAYATTPNYVTVNGLVIYRYQGGGIWLGRGENTVSNNTVTRNTVTNFGGGIHITSGTHTVTQNTIFANRAYSGGGIYSTSSTNDIYNNTIYGNTGYIGGGIYLIYGTNVVRDNTLYSNKATGSAGGMYSQTSAATISNNVLYKNTAAQYAGGLYLKGTNQILNNTIVGNEATSFSGGGIYVEGSGTTIKNNIFWDNKVASNSDDIGGTPNTVSHCLTQAGSPFSIGVGIINNQDPLFVNIDDIDGPDNIHRTPDDGLQLLSLSPAINTGIIGVEIPTTDIVGDTRAQYGLPDMGAYEHTGCGEDSRTYVDATRPDNSGDGLSWATAKKDIQAAINALNGCGQVWVKAGTYKPTQEPDGTTDTPRDFTFYLHDNVAVYGGFAGTEISSAQRNITTNVTILSGDIGALNNDTDNAYHVVVVNNPDNSNRVIVDGFRITGGNANDASNLVLNGTNIPRGNGGGICILNGTSAIRNNTLDNNSCSRLGGGIYALSGVHNITQNEISNNIASTRGGGIYSENATVTIHNNTIQSNTASVRGGGVYTKSGTSTITNNTIIHNTGSLRGGGIYTEATVSTLGNNVLKSNTAQYGGGIYTEVGTNTILNNTIVQNISSVKGGGLYTYQGSNVVKNCLFWDNVMGTATNVLGADLAEYVSSNTVTYCLTQQNSLYSSGVGIVNNQDPLFTNIADIDGADNTHRTADDGLVLSCATPVWNQQVLDVGLNADILGVVRPQQVGVRYGAYESLGGCSFYVDASRPDNTGSGTSWATAKRDVQDAINLALAGDQVWVRAGTYKPTQYPAGCSGCTDARDYTFFVKDGVMLYGGFAGTETILTQRNIAANTTTLSGEIGNLTDTTDNSYHVVMVVAPSTGGIGVTVDGFTIRGAYATTTDFVTINGLSIYRYQGGGIWLRGGTNTISNNTITRNTVTNFGGGIYTASGTHTITQNTIFANRAYSGGGIYSVSGTKDIYNNTLYGNIGYHGGGAYLIKTIGKVRDNTIYNNTASYGGGLYVDDAYTSNISNNVLYKNKAIGTGGGIYLNSDGNSILNNTIVGNQTVNTTYGGGIYVNDYSTTIIKNCIFWDNKASIYTSDVLGGDINMSYCLTQAGNTGLGVINNQNPLFVDINDIDGPDNIHRTADDGLNLQSLSPCVDKGAIDARVPKDILGNIHTQYGIPDIGAYEQGADCHNTYRIHVDAARPDNSGDGLSWATAKKDIQAAINTVNGCGQVWVKAGTYKPTQEPDGTIDTPRDFTFYLQGSVGIYGGFAGTETALEQRNITVNVTTLSGDIGVPNSNTDNTYHVVVANNPDNNNRVTVDGFHITGGNANNASNLVLNGTNIPRSNGGGICTLNGNNTVRNNTLINNACSRLGGGIYVLSGIHTIAQNEISNNTASTRGGGIYTENVNVTIHNNTIQSNTASVRGGGVYTKSGTSTITNNTVINNTGSLRGGGIYTEASVSKLGNNVLKSNTAEYGGGIYTEVGTNTILNSTIVQNISSVKGGGLYTYQGSNVVKNCLFWDNAIGVATNVLGADLAEYVSSNSVTYCLTQQNSLYSSGVGIVNNQDPIFTNITDIDGADNIHRTADDGLILSCATPVWNQQVLDVGLSTDILGVLRPQQVGVKYGAYEVVVSGCSFYVDASRPDNTGAGTSWATAKKDVQNAINLALAGDQVWVRAGTYKPTQYPPNCSGCGGVRDYTFFVKDGVKLYGGFAGTETSLTQRNMAANTTTLSGEIGNLNHTNDNSFHVVMAVAPSLGGIGVTIDGFTIQGGNAATSNSAVVNGVSVYRYQGGGIWLGGGTNTISNNIITRNMVTQFGGGIYTSSGTHTITQNTIFANRANTGGGICSGSSISDIYRNTIYDNTGRDGGGIYLVSGMDIVRNNTLYSNTAENYGGGVYLSGETNATILNNVCYKNKATNNAGGLYLNGGTNQVLNNTIVGNEVTSTASSVGVGVGIYIAGSGTTIKNCIFWDNGTFLNSKDIVGESTNISHCLTQSGSPFDTGLSIINNQDPLFANINDIDGPDNIHRTADDGLQLLLGSPAANVGIMDVGVQTTDILGATRPQYGIPDMGAYEQGVSCTGFSIAYVDATRPDNSGDGLSWATAKKDIQAAINIVDMCGQVWVKAGTYKPTQEPDGTTDTPRDFTFYLHGALGIYGGFAGTETMLNQRNIATNITTLSGDIGVSNSNADNSYHVVVVHNQDNSNRVTVDGFHITGGNASDASNLVLNGTSIPRGNGAGICILNGTSAIRNNTLTNNTCSRLGGGIYVLSGIHTFSQNEISSNIAYKRGGGIYSEDASVTIHNNTIQSNSASVRGGGVYVKNDTSAITNNTIINNTGSLRGGGIYTEMTVSTLGNNTIKSNTAEYGGGIYVEVGTNTLLNNTIVQNNSSAQGGGLYTYQGSNIVKNCIFWDNMMGTATNISGADLTEYVSSNSVTYCLTQQNSLYSSGVGIVNNQDPLFSNIADIDGVDNIHRTADDGLILSCSTPAWNQQVLDIGLSTDILGVARPQRVGVRYGAYELSLGGCSFYVDASRPNNTGAGTSWATAKKDVQDAINLALAGDQVWVKAGTYKPTQAPPGCLGCEDAIMRSYTFFVKDGVSLYGGFAGTETSLSQRNIAANTTILSGEIGDLTQFGDNSFHIVMAVAPSSGGIGVTVDGFTIQGAYAARAQSITVNGVVIYCFQGGGIWIGGGANTISNNTIARNRVSNVGGGIYTLHGTHTITQNTIVANLAEGFGGGIYSDNSISNIYNNTLYDNTSNRGGGLYLNVGTNQILNNTIIGNEVTSTTSSGGGIYVGGTNSVIKNCIFWNNTVGSNSDDIGGVPIEVTHCLTQAGSSYSIGVGIINNQDPQFVNINDVDGPDDKYRTADDGLRLLPCSPAINTGTNAQVFTTTDITGAPRIQEGTVDIGAYESSSLAAYTVRTDELTANATCLEGEWTHYVNTTENALLLSVKKNGNDIGSIGDGTLRVTAGGTGASRLTADDDAQENWYRTNRHWSISATHPPQTDMSVRFYYRTEDADALMNMAGISDASDMVFYTAADGSAESMERGEAGKSVDIYTRGREASTSRWLWGISPDADSHSYAEMVVAPFEKDIDGAGAAIRKVAPSLPKDIELYPNPSRGLVQVTGVDLGGTSVTVRNVLGQEQAWVRDGNVLNLSELPAGVYFIEFAGRAGAYQIVKE